ncbi:secreted protein/lipoprotein [Streptomyces sp. NPDC087901]|uniref:secreted protein/lipoprotein n=1 Tax=Streptomyces sp. NPDC087901 TaxID=3365818 RepID=UPI0038178DBD
MKQTPSKPADPTETTKTEAVATYQKYWQAMERLYADVNAKNTDLKQYAAGAALKNAESDAKSMHDKGHVISGQVTVGSPTVTSVDINRKIPNAKISSCLDISHWQVIDSTTKKPVALPPKRLTKYVIVSTVERWPEGWRVISDEPRGKKC